MAFENGYNVYDYCQHAFKKYKNDSLVFVKALQIVQSFSCRSDYPYCINELDEAVKHILGESISDFAYMINRYVTYLEEQMIWDPREALNIDGKDFDPDTQDITIDLLSEYDKEEGDRIAENFKNDIKAFCITLKPIFDKIFMMEDNPLGIKKVMVDENTSSEKRSIRLIRNDDKYLDVRLNSDEIKSLIDALKKLRKSFD
ncbi:MAG: hypothetical protein PHD70_14840 [Anaerostipes sp.]|nr:hypothetical protein [Anaerostipes sp.]MDD4372231.1 hypothetical protein [Anaerostipes sp.]